VYTRRTTPDVPAGMTGRSALLRPAGRPWSRSSHPRPSAHSRHAPLSNRAALAGGRDPSSRRRPALYERTKRMHSGTATPARGRHTRELINHPNCSIRRNAARQTHYRAVGFMIVMGKPSESGGFGHHDHERQRGHISTDRPAPPSGVYQGRINPVGALTRRIRSRSFDRGCT